MTRSRAPRGPAITVATILLAAAVAAWIVRPLTIVPSATETLVFVDRSGLPLGTLLPADGRRAAWIPLHAVAPAFVAAILATEDARFWRHGPLDPRATTRALLQAIASGNVPHGASTVAMQLGRLLAPVGEGLRGRLAEAVLAARLENGASKRRILEAYCNEVPMGGNFYGVEAASLAYFGIHASGLDLAQASLLAAIPNDPTRLQPYGAFAALLERRRAVLARMVANGSISTLDAARAAAEKPALQPASAGFLAAPQALFSLAAAARGTGTVVHTTLDRPLQEFVEEQLRAVVHSLVGHDAGDAAALVVENSTGAIRAYAGSADYFSKNALGRNDGVRALRQPGSALKPFLYELALERRVLRPNSVLLDAPVAYSLPGERLYAPRDYDGRFLGPVRVRLALANSLNVPAVRTLERVGVAAFLERLRALGFEHLRRTADYYGLGLTLGGGEVSLFELTRAYVTLARGGVPADVHLNADATVPAPPAGERDAAWSLVTDILADDHARAAAFGVDSVLALPFAAAVKTGTSSDFRDTWTVGFSRDYTVGVWVGNFDGRPMRAISGVTGAGPLWNRIMLRLHEREDPAPFDAPAGYARTPICAATGLRPSRTCEAVVLEWLDRADRAALRTAHAKTVVAPVVIAYPHDGDRFALMPGGGPQDVDVTLAPDGLRDVSVSVDGRRLARHDGAFSFALALGHHAIVARHGAWVTGAHIDVEPPPPRGRPGFSIVH